jgi:hypothetical protein
MVSISLVSQLRKPSRTSTAVTPVAKAFDSEARRKTVSGVAGSFVFALA